MSDDPFRMQSIQTSAFFTGHRQIPEAGKTNLSVRLFHCISDAYDLGYRTFYCGCALGFDTMAAFQVIQFRASHPDVILSLAIPCETQALRWPAEDRQNWQTLQRMADEKVVLSREYYEGVMMNRNRYMADRSSLCICYLVRFRGGTASTVRYAIRNRQINVINLAVHSDNYPVLMRENAWSSISTFHSVKRNVPTAPFHLLSGKKLRQKSTLTSC